MNDSIDKFARKKITRLEQPDMRPSVRVLLMKATLDAIGAAGGLLFMGLTYPWIAAAIRLDSEGPLLYTQLRIGINRRNRKRNGSLPDGIESDRRREDLGGKPFHIYKYRTMRTDAEAQGPKLCATTGDPRVTRVGKWLRALHLDETAQFLNLARGEMSLIGPRPERPHYTSQYGRDLPYYSDRTYLIKPGLTGLAQIILGYDESEESVIRKSHYDLSYRASFSGFYSWIRMEAWVFRNTLVYLLQRPNVNGVTRDLVGLRRAKLLPFQSRALASAQQPAKVTVSFSKSESSRIMVGTDPFELANKLDCLDISGRRCPEIFVHTKEHLDLEYMGLLLGLAHKVKQGGGRLWVICPNRFVHKILREIRLETVAELQYNPPIRNFLTIDVECWFHAYNLAEKTPASTWHLQSYRIHENMEKLLGLLRNHEAKATFFVLGWIADHFPEIVRWIAAEGHEIATHGHYHRLVTGMTPEEFERDLQQSLEALSRHTSQPIRGHRASNFTVVKDTLWALEILERNGIEYDSSIFPFARKRYGIRNYPFRYPHTLQLPNGGTLTELPMSTMKMGNRLMPVAGGGYFRLYPSRLTEAFISRANGHGLPAMVYLHPWELDAGQKRLFVGLGKTFQHYVNMETTEWKLDRLLHRYAFTSIKEGLNTRRVKTLLRKNSLSIAGLFENSDTAALNSTYLADMGTGEFPAYTNNGGKVGVANPTPEWRPH